MKRVVHFFLAIVFYAHWGISLTAQNVIHMDLQGAIRIATDSSLLAFKYKNMFRSSYWQWRTYRSERLPSLTFNASPAVYNRYLTQRYDSESNMDVYREQRSLLSEASLTLSQNFTPLGGTFFVKTSLDRLRNYGSSTSDQFSAVPVKIGYSNSLLGYNSLRWDKRIEPVKYEKAKLLFLYNAEYVAAYAVEYFFNLAKAQAQKDLAERRVAWSDTLYALGQRRKSIAAISQNDLKQLRLDVVNARSSLTQAQVNVRRAQMSMASFLGLSPDADLRLQLPGAVPDFTVDAGMAVEQMHANSYVLREQEQSLLEYEQNLDRVRRETHFQASLSASVGFNQQGETISDAYSAPLRQDVVSLSVSIPLLDWGVGRGRRNMARSQLEAARIEAQQKTAEKEQEVLVTICELTSQRELLAAAEEALKLSEDVYRQTIVLYANGVVDLARLNIAQNSMIAAQNSYLDCMYNLWECHFRLRRLTLFDFMLGLSLSQEFDFENIADGR